MLAVLSNRPLTETVNEMKLSGVQGLHIQPGQFVNIQIEGLYLRRPISVCDVNEDVLTIVYRTVGRGTDALSRMKEGQLLDVLCELGSGYDLSRSGKNPLLIGGGVGVPPLYFLARKLLAQGKQVTVILGFNTKAEIFYEEEFRALGARVIVTTADGTYGTKGFVTDALVPCDYFYACGPIVMEKAIHKIIESDGEYSLEERMGCGFGACMGCSLETASGNKRICREGPVFRKEELLWND